jgi:hypothetical protein
MKHRHCKSSVREFHRLDICNPGAMQAARHRQGRAILGRPENRQRHGLVVQTWAWWRQMGRCRASALKPILFPRPRTQDHGAFLFFYKFARTTLLGRWNYKKSTQCNCCTIGHIHGSRAAQKAGNSRQRGAYFLHIAARRLISRPRFGKALRPRCHALTIRPVHCWPASGKRRI